MIRDDSDLVACLDQIILECLLAEIPPSPEPIARGAAQALCYTFCDSDFEDYRAQIERIVRERLRTWKNFDDSKTN